MQYNVIAKDSRTELINAVQKSIDNGWTVVGGISLAVVNVNNIVFAQTLTKE